jgi:hypothetical protein
VDVVEKNMRAGFDKLALDFLSCGCALITLSWQR